MTRRILPLILALATIGSAQGAPDPGIELGVNCGPQCVQIVTGIVSERGAPLQGLIEETDEDGDGLTDLLALRDALVRREIDARLETVAMNTVRTAPAPAGIVHMHTDVYGKPLRHFAVFERLGDKHAILYIPPYHVERVVWKSVAPRFSEVFIAVAPPGTKRIGPIWIAASVIVLGCAGLFAWRSQGRRKGQGA